MSTQSLPKVRDFLQKAFGSKAAEALTSLAVLASIPALVNWMHQTYCHIRYGETEGQAPERKLSVTGWMVGLGLAGMLFSPLVMIANFFLPFLPGFWLLFLFGSTVLLGGGLLLKLVLGIMRGLGKIFMFVGRSGMTLLQQLRSGGQSTPAA